MNKENSDFPTDGQVESDVAYSRLLQKVMDIAKAMSESGSDKDIKNLESVLEELRNFQNAKKTAKGQETMLESIKEVVKSIINRFKDEIKTN